MSYSWEPQGGTFNLDELRQDGLMPDFETQSEAEEWMGQNFEVLLEAGVTEMTLLGPDHQVIYGPMSLEA